MAQMRTVKGVAVAPGLAIGPVHVVHAARDAAPTWSVPEEDVPRELSRLHAAIRETSGAIEQQQKLVAQQLGERDASIFGLHKLMLGDPVALKEVETTIREQRINAEAAVQHMVDRVLSSLAGDGGDRVRGSWSQELIDPWRRVLDALMRTDKIEMEKESEQVVIAAAELTPQVVTFLERSRVLAVVCETGGRYSHGAVLARSFGFPCVVGLPNLLSRLEQGMRVCVDGDAATVGLRPASGDVDRFLARIERRKARQKKLALHAGEPAVTTDGHAFATQVNIESVRDLDAFPFNHCDGVGLLRTEFMYMERPQFPSEEEQYRLYRRVLERMGGRPVTLRTLDIGNDKQLPYFKTPKEANPALGWRGLRISLEWQDLLRVQLRAALRASAHGPLRVLLPMVSSLEEVQEVHRVFNGVKKQLLDQGFEVAADVPVGVMVEVPSAVFAIEQLLLEADFVSVGTNDLVQYLLAVDRDNPRVARLYDPHNPAVFAALAHVARAARAAGKQASVCGEMAGDYATALALLGMGFHSVSVVPTMLPEIKYAVRETSFVEAKEIARAACSQSTAEGVRGVLAAARERLHQKQLSDRNGDDAFAESDVATDDIRREGR
jgi:phosphotransferase system enzyme I (PtsI)